MHLKYQPAFENPLALGITLFLSLCSMFALGVAILNFGRYGYIPEWSFFWSLYALIIHWNVGVRLERKEGSWHYQITLFNKPIRSKIFDDIEVVNDGKYNYVVGIFRDVRLKTWITGNEEYKESTLGFIKAE
ncbi:MAG: hypothetical protein ACI9JN_002751 [Bacteroidia bacterium]|jgi:hypothetical protein